MDDAIAVVAEAAARAGRDPAALGMEGRLVFGGQDTKTLADSAERWRETGATHLAINTHGVRFARAGRPHGRAVSGGRGASTKRRETRENNGASKLNASRIPARTPPFVWRVGLPGSEPELEGGLLRICTDDGVEGIAPTRRGVILEDLVNRRLREELVGEDPLRREWLWHRVWELDRIEEFPVYVLGLVDVALHDLAGKALGVPVYELLGAFRAEIPAYASTVTFASIESTSTSPTNAWSLVTPPSNSTPGATPGATLPWPWPSAPMWATTSTSCTTAPPASTCLTPSTWAEPSPTPATAGTRNRCGNSALPPTSGWLNGWKCPLLVAETSDGAHMNTADFISSGCATYVRTSTGLKGGFTGALRIAHTADSFRLRAEVHGGGLANIHLCMAIPNTTYYESLVMDNPVVKDPVVDEHGLVHAPTEPGVGATSAFV